MHKFYLKEIPNSRSVWGWIKEHTDVVERFEKLTCSVDPGQLIRLQHTFNIAEIQEACKDAIEKFGFNTWQNNVGGDHGYGGLSLVYNPDYIDTTINTNAQTLGTARNSPEQFFYGSIENFETIRNTYFDSYSFRLYSPCVTESKLYNFIKDFKRSPIRSRLATIKSENVPEAVRAKYGWHKDEPIFENLRINIPITTDDTYMFQLAKQTPVHLDIGNMYSWDTHLPHRVFPTTNEQKTRTHLVLGFSPWFDYNPKDDSFTSNEFYGKMHPIDMLINGHVHEKIKGLC
jgi:hypothetical protein